MKTGCEQGAHTYCYCYCYCQRVPHSATSFSQKWHPIFLLLWYNYNRRRTHYVFDKLISLTGKKLSSDFRKTQENTLRHAFVMPSSCLRFFLRAIFAPKPEARCLFYCFWLTDSLVKKLPSSSLLRPFFLPSSKPLRIKLFS